MADRKISDLTALTTPASGDYLPIVDISEASAANKNKRITIEELLRGAPDGTAAAPGFAFESDGGNGLYLAGTDTVGLATNGVSRITVSTTAVSSALAVDHPLGAVGTPSITFTGRLNTGFWSPAADTLAASTGGTERARIDSSGTLTVKGAGTAGVNAAVSFNGSAPVNSLVIDSSGRVGVGTSSPAVAAHISVSTTTDTEVLRIENSNATGGASLRIDRNNTTRAAHIQHSTGGTTNWFAGIVRNAGINTNGYSIGQGQDIGLTTPAIHIDTSNRVGVGTSSPSSLVHLADAGNITVGTTTGTKIGTATTQKLGFYNATPVVQPTAVADATDAASVITQLNALLSRMRTLGLIAT